MEDRSKLEHTGELQPSHTTQVMFAAAYAWYAAEAVKGREAPLAWKGAR